jgi:hypothetical protein
MGFSSSGDSLFRSTFQMLFFTAAGSISPAGEIVGHYQDASGSFHGFLLSRGEFTSIDFPGQDDSPEHQGRKWLSERPRDFRPSYSAKVFVVWIPIARGRSCLRG